MSGAARDDPAGPFGSEAICQVWCPAVEAGSGGLEADPSGPDAARSRDRDRSDRVAACCGRVEMDAAVVDDLVHAGQSSTPRIVTSRHPAGRGRRRPDRGTSSSARSSRGSGHRQHEVGLLERTDLSEEPRRRQQVGLVALLSVGLGPSGEGVLLDRGVTGGVDGATPVPGSSAFHGGMRAASVIWCMKLGAFPPCPGR